MYISNWGKDVTTVSAYRLLSSSNNKQILFDSFYKKPCMFYPPLSNVAQSPLPTKLISESLSFLAIHTQRWQQQQKQEQQQPLKDFKNGVIVKIYKS